MKKRTGIFEIGKAGTIPVTGYLAKMTENTEMRRRIKIEEIKILYFEHETGQ